MSSEHNACVTMGDEDVSECMNECRCATMVHGQVQSHSYIKHGGGGDGAGCISDAIVS